MESLSITVTHSGLTNQSLLLDDIDDGGRGASSGLRPGPVYVPVGGSIELVYTKSVALSFEFGTIRRLADSGAVTASMVLGSSFPDATSLSTPDKVTGPTEGITIITGDSGDDVSGDILLQNGTAATTQGKTTISTRLLELLTTDGIVASTYGNARGAGSFDMQMVHSAVTQVALGDYSAQIASKESTVNGDYSASLAATDSYLHADAYNSANIATGSSWSNAEYSVIGGGREHLIYGEFNTISGGGALVVGTSYSGMFAGFGNVTSYNAWMAAVVAGYENIVDANGSVIAGSQRSKIWGARNAQYGVIAGGNENLIVGYNNNATAQFSGILAGAHNLIGSRTLNIDANYSSIQAGWGNLVQASYSTAQGHFAHAGDMFRAKEVDVAGPDTVTVLGDLTNAGGDQFYKMASGASVDFKAFADRVWDSTGTFASGTFTLAGLPNDGDYIIIWTTRYYFHTVPEINSSFRASVKIGATVATTLGNLQGSINRDLFARYMLPGNSQEKFSPKNADQRFMTCSAPAGSSVTVTAVLPGIAANAFATTAPINVSGNLSWGAATMTGGSLGSTVTGVTFDILVGESVITFSAAHGVVADDVVRSNTNVSVGARDATGYQTIAGGDFSRVGGYQSSATGLSAFAWGNYVHAPGRASMAFGEACFATGPHSFASGWFSYATAESSTALGWGYADGVYSLAVGFATYAHGYAGTTIGAFTSAGGRASFASGETTHAIGDYSFAGGIDAHAGDIWRVEGVSGTTITVYGDATGKFTTSQAVEYKGIQEVGPNSRTGVWELSVQTVSSIDAYDVATHTTTLNMSATVTGVVAQDVIKATANIVHGQFAFGQQANAFGAYAVAIGGSALAAGDYSTALGIAWAFGKYGFAAGWSTAHGYLSTAFGFGEASGRGSFAAGYGAYATGDHATALGKYSLADIAGEFALGGGSADFAAGEGQVSVFSFMAKTTDGTLTTLAADGNQLVLRDDHALGVRVIVTGRKTDGQTAMFEGVGIIRRTSGTVVLTTTANLVKVEETSVVTWTAVMAENDTAKTLDINVQNGAETVKWHALVLASVAGGN